MDMELEFNQQETDFRSTPLENMFLDTFLAQASGNQLKVYLYGWRCCYSGEDRVSLEDLSSACGLSKEEVLEALDFWKDTGLVIEVPGQAGPCLHFQSMVLLWTGYYDRKHPGEQEPPSPSSGTGTKTEPDFAGEGPLSPPVPEVSEQEARDRKRMFDALEDFLSSGLSYRVRLKENEIRAILDLLDQYPISANFFVYAYEKAIEQSESSSRSFSYILTIIENWIRFEKLTDMESLDQYLERQQEKKEKRKTGRRSRAKQKIAFAHGRPGEEEMSQQEWLRKRLEAARKRGLEEVEDHEKDGA